MSTTEINSDESNEVKNESSRTTSRAGLFTDTHKSSQKKLENEKRNEQKRQKMKKHKDEAINQLSKVAISVALSFLICSFIAFIITVAPNDNVQYQEDLVAVKSVSPGKETGEELASDKIVGAASPQVEHPSYVADQSKLPTVHYVGSKLDFFVEHLSKEFSWNLFFMLLFSIYGFQYTGIWKDYFPTSPRAKESGIHAKLNYQVIADRLSRKLSILLIFILLFAISFIFTIFRFATDLDTIIHDKDIRAYNSWILQIEKHLGKYDKEVTEGQKGKINDFVEENTKLFWYVFFTRFIVIRCIIAITVGIIISFLIKLYNRTRNDKEGIIGKEEALSAIHYLARGEWRFKYDLEGNLLYEGVNRVITERQFHELSEEDKPSFKPQLLEHLGSNEHQDAHLKTRDLLNIIPVHELFKITVDTRSTRKQKEIEHKEMIHDSSNMTKGELSDVSDELKKITALLADITAISKAGNP